MQLVNYRFIRYHFQPWHSRSTKWNVNSKYLNDTNINIYNVQFSDQPSSSSKYLSPQKGLVDLTECLELLLPPAIHRDRRQSTTGAAGIELEQMSISDVSEEEKEETCSQLTDSPEYEPPSDMSTE